MPNEMTSGEAKVLAAQLQQVDARGQRIEGAVTDLAKEMGTLIRLTERQVFMSQELTRCFDEVKKERLRGDEQDRRLVTLHDDVEPLKRTKAWMLGIAGAVITAMITGFVTGTLTVHLSHFGQ